MDKAPPWKSRSARDCRIPHRGPWARMDGLRLLLLRVLQSCAWLDMRERHKKPPGGSRGTPGRMPSRVPCDVSLNRRIACLRVAWTAGWFSYPVSPGFHPGLFVWASGLEGRVDSKRAAARQANRGTKPRVRVDHVPGFPPGASWTGDETESQFNGSAKQRSHADSCSGAALLNSSAQHQNLRPGL